MTCCPPVLQCRLFCSPGRVSSPSPLVSCVRGRYEPTRPSAFRCEPAAALIVTPHGRMEVFSSEARCSQRLSNTPSLPFTGYSVDLLDSQLVVAGYDLERAEWKYAAMEAPRTGLLANPWRDVTPVAPDTPDSHSSHILGHDLVLPGGLYNSQARLETGVLGTFTFLWPNKTAVSSFASSSCGVRLSSDLYMVLGGVEQGENPISSKVIAVNVSDQTVQERPNLLLARADHSCEVLGDSSILISGGYSAAREPFLNIVADEIYHIETGQSVALDGSLDRYQHQLILLTDTVFSLGGRGAEGSPLSDVKKFDPVRRRWLPHDSGLLSGDSGQLAVTAFPQSGIDCVDGCRSRGQNLETFSLFRNFYLFSLLVFHSP